MEIEIKDLELVHGGLNLFLWLLIWLELLD